MVLLPRQHFRRDLLRRASLRGQDVRRHLLVFGQAEVNQLDIPVVFLHSHEIFRFQVTVHNIALVTLVE